MRLSNRQFQELLHLEQAGRPLWGGVPATDADADLSHYITNGFVTRKREGYVITKAGEKALRLERILRQERQP